MATFTFPNHLKSYHSRIFHLFDKSHSFIRLISYTAKGTYHTGRALNSSIIIIKKKS